jgi:transcriptional regulator with XRE-family HTH domain/tetratricopeptide (TPR) repeat protein
VANPAEVTEAWRALGQQLAASRRAAKLSQERLASLVGYSRSTVANAETGRQPVVRTFWQCCDEALGTGTALARGHDDIADLQRNSHVRSAAVAHRARTAAIGSGIPDPGLGSATDVGGAASGLDQAESVRRWLTGVLVGGAVSPSSIDAWEQAVLHHGRATRIRPAGEHLTELMADLAEVGHLIERSRSASSLRSLVRVTAHLSGLVCLLFVKLDERDAFRRWAATARVAAAESGEPATLSWALAQEAYGHFYSGDLRAAVSTAQQAQELMHGTPFVGAALAAALEGRTHAACGRVQETLAALGRAEEVLAALAPGSVTSSAFGYTESQFRFHQGNAFTRLRDTRRALAAQEQALQLCPPADYTDWALTRLDRASCICQDGDAPAAVEYATETVIQLRAGRSQGIIALRAEDFVRGLPPRYRSADPVRELEHLISPAPAGKEIPGP